MFPSIDLGLAVLAITIAAAIMVAITLIISLLKKLKIKFPESQIIKFFIEYFFILMIFLFIIAIAVTRYIYEDEKSELTILSKVSETQTLLPIEGEHNGKCITFIERDDDNDYIAYYNKKDNLGEQPQTEFIDSDEIYFEYQDRNDAVMNIFKETTENEKLDRYLDDELETKYQILLPSSCINS